MIIDLFVNNSVMLIVMWRPYFHFYLAWLPITIVNIFDKVKRKNVFVQSHQIFQVGICWFCMKKLLILIMYLHM